MRVVEMLDFCAGPQTSYNDIRYLLDYDTVPWLIGVLNADNPGAVFMPAPALDLHDFISHRDSWRKALVIARDAAKVVYPDIDDRSYWEHEIEAFDRAFEIIAPMAKAPVQQLINEYRPSMNEDVMRMWAGELVLALKGQM